MEIKSIDHLVLTVKNIDVTIDFYQQVLGMSTESFGNGRTALTYGSQKINLHKLGQEFEPKALNVKTGSADVCFITETPIDEAAYHLEREGIAIIEGPVKRTGAKGKIISIYFRDPDGNLIELSNY